MAMPAFAQDSTTPSPGSPSAPVENVAPAPAPSAAPAPIVTPDAAIPDKTADKGRATAAGLGSEVAASDLLNQKVKNSANETGGDINDLSIGSDGKIAAVIIGLGGFLGMGEKNVSLPYDQLNFSRDANGYLIVTVNATKDSLQGLRVCKRTLSQTRLLAKRRPVSRRNLAVRCTGRAAVCRQIARAGTPSRHERSLVLGGIQHA
jgi:hypothetical protein